MLGIFIYNKNIMFFKNKHVITSLIVAPILAIISYFAVDYYVAEVPHKAKDGQLYKLLAKPNCRWESGYCDLVNGNLELLITTNSLNYGQNYLHLRSETPLQKVNFSLVNQKNSQSSPKSMVPADAAGTSWQSSLIQINKTDYLQFAVQAGGSTFYVEVPAIFVYKDKDF